MPVTGGVGLAVHVRQGFGVAGIARLSNRKVQGNGDAGVPVAGNWKPGAKNKICVKLAPIGAPRDRLPASVVYVWGNWGISRWTRQPQILKMRQWSVMTINQRLDQAQALVNSLGCPANIV